MQNLDFFKKGMNIIGGLLDRQWEGERGWGRMWSKYIVCTYEKIIMKPT
jgi:hypothetical protein